MSNIDQMVYPQTGYARVESDQASGPSVSEEMGRAVGNLTDRLAQLANRLDPVLRPPAPEARGDVMPPALTLMRRHLYDLLCLTEVVGDLLERLDV